MEYAPSPPFPLLPPPSTMSGQAALVAVHHVVQVAGAPGPPLPQQAVHRLVTLAAAASRATARRSRRALAARRRFWDPFWGASLAGESSPLSGAKGTPQVKLIPKRGRTMDTDAHHPSHGPTQVLWGRASLAWNIQCVLPAHGLFPKVNHNGYS